MTLASQYARALYALIEENPKHGATHLRNLSSVLKRRGHDKLLAQIFSAYRSLELAKERREKHAAVTPEKERTRILLELYRKLITTA